MTRVAPRVVVPLLLLCACGASSASSLAPKTGGPTATATSARGSEPRCGRRPAPATSASLETSLAFPPVVSNHSPGQLIVHNTSSKTVTLEVNLGWMASTAQGNNITSAKPPSAEAVTVTTFAPGQTLEFPVILEAFACGSDGSVDTTQRISNGLHEALVTLKINEGPLLASVAVTVNYQAAL